jgi:hypothetical protein
MVLVFGGSDCGWVDFWWVGLWRFNWGGSDAMAAIISVVGFWLVGLVVVGRVCDNGLNCGGGADVVVWLWWGGCDGGLNCDALNFGGADVMV